MGARRINYLRKPFVFGELEARLRSIVRRNHLSQVLDARLRYDDLVFDLSSRHVVRGFGRQAIGSMRPMGDLRSPSAQARSLLHY